jgi:hypothetical protein
MSKNSVFRSTLLIAGLGLASVAPAAAQATAFKVTAVRSVTDGRIAISFSDNLGTCGKYPWAAEVASDAPGRDLHISVALAALLSGKQVKPAVKCVNNLYELDSLQILD